MSGEAFAVILMHSTSHALRAEKVLAGVGLGSKLIPVPRQLSSDCGICVRVARGDVEAAVQVLREAGMALRTIHDI